MILNLEDYAKFPSAIINLKTNNVSFKKYAGLLKKMGLKNWMWPLMLLDPRLEGVDPHDPDLTEEQKTLCRVEARYNPVFAIRECFKIPAASGSELMPFRAGRGSMAVIWAFFQNIDTFYMQIRQTGKTTTLYTILNVCAHIVQRGSKNLLITKDNELRKTNIAAIKQIRDTLPGWMNPYQAGVDADNQEEITVKRYNNKIYTGVGRKDPVGANKQGRGYTVPVPLFDEPAFTDNIDITYPAAIASGNEARPSAIRNGMPAASIMSTTAGERNRKEGKFCYNKQIQAARFTELYFDIVGRDRLKRVIRNQSTGDVECLNIEFDHLQLGYTNEWLYEAIKKAGGSIDAINRDFFNIWSNGTDKSPLTKGQKDSLLATQREPDYLEVTNDDFVLNWYVPQHKIAEQMKKKHILGVDTSDAVGRDSITFNFTSVDTGEDIATACFNNASLPQAANWLGDLMVKYPNTLLVIESKSSARTFIDVVIMKLASIGEDPFKRIYNSIVQNYDADPHRKLFAGISDRRFGMSTYMSYKKYFGFSTTGNLRNTLYGPVFSRSLDYQGCYVDKQLVKECLGLVIKNGRMDHTSDSHDDNVVAKLLAMYVLMEGRNLKYYGIEPSHIFRSAKKANDIKKTTREIYKESREEQYREEYNSLEERYEKARSETEKRIISGRMARLKQYLGDDEAVLTNFDAMVNRLSESQKQGLTEWKATMH